MAFCPGAVPIPMPMGRENGSRGQCRNATASLTTMTHDSSAGAHEALRRYWGLSLSAAGAASSEDAIEGLLQRWDEPLRAYHTTQHLQEALDLLCTWCGGGTRCIRHWPSALALALFFHDAIYDPQRADNEEASAQLARSILGPLGVPGDLLSAVDRLIDVTRHAAMPVSEDECLMVDIDLAILGARSERYAQYRTQVRQEYRHVPERAFLRGRLGVVERFLGQGQGLFHTERGRAELGAQALRNLAAEALDLRQQLDH